MTNSTVPPPPAPIGHSHLDQLSLVAGLVQSLRPLEDAFMAYRAIHRQRQALELDARLLRYSLDNCPHGGKCDACVALAKSLADAILGGRS